MRGRAVPPHPRIYQVPPPPPWIYSNLQIRKRKSPGLFWIRDWSKSIGGGGPEQRRGGSSVFEPLVRGGSFNFQLPLRGGSSFFLWGLAPFDNKGNSF